MLRIHKNLSIRSFNSITVSKKNSAINLISFFARHFFKGTGRFFETLSVGSVPGTDHS